VLHYRRAVQSKKKAVISTSEAGEAVPTPKLRLNRVLPRRSKQVDNYFPESSSFDDSYEESEEINVDNESDSSYTDDDNHISD
jgi:hypothetical protein